MKEFLSFGLVLRWRQERFGVYFAPFRWVFSVRAAERGATLDDTPYNSVVAFGPLRFVMMDHSEPITSGPAIILSGRVGYWSAELRFVPLMWRLRVKPRFVSCGPFKLVWAPEKI